jgi:hypothetical protein
MMKNKKSSKKKGETNAEASSSGRKKGKRFYEIFKVGKKQKIIKVEGVEPEKKVSKNQIKEENKILKNIFMLIGGVIILILIGYLIIDNMKNFEYKGVSFKTVKFCDVEPCLILYQTTFPVISDGKNADYNIYLRNDPRKLDSIIFNGKMNLFGDMVINSTGDFSCDGDGIIAVANMVNFYELLGTNIFKNETLGCNNQDKYTFVQILEGNETKIEQIGFSCYNIEINNCEILEATERFMIESFIKVNDYLN